MGRGTAMSAAKSLAVACLVSEMLFSTVSNVLLRITATDLSPESVLFLRLVAATLILTPWLMSLPASRQAVLGTLSNRARLIRYALCGVVSYLASLAWLYAMVRLPLAVATSLFFTTAIFMSVMGRWALAEPFTGRNGAALVIGLVGVWLVLKPSFLNLRVDGVVAALVAAALAAFAMTLLKTLCGRDSPALSALMRMAPAIPVAAIAALFAWNWAAHSESLALARLFTIDSIAPSLARLPVVVGASPSRTSLLTAHGTPPSPGRLLTIHDTSPSPGSLLATHDTSPSPGSLLTIHDTSPSPGSLLTIHDTSRTSSLPAHGAWPSPTALLAIGVAALLLILGQAAAARAYDTLHLSQASVLEYLRLIFATTAGILVFNEAVGLTTLIGGAVIIAAALIGASESSAALVKAERRAA